MRAKVFLAVVIATLGLLVCLALLRPEQGAGTPERAVHDSGGPSPPAVVGWERLPAKAQRSEAAPAASNTNAAAEAASQAQFELTVSKRITELAELAMNDDAGSLGMILSELGNPQPQVRNAALQATIQFGSRDAIPYLSGEAARTDDPTTRRALEDAIAYLSLPSLTEVLQQRAQAPDRVTSSQGAQSLGPSAGR